MLLVDAINEYAKLIILDTYEYLNFKMCCHIIVMLHKYFKSRFYICI